MRNTSIGIDTFMRLYFYPGRSEGQSRVGAKWGV
jgi:hypothetical protein